MMMMMKMMMMMMRLVLIGVAIAGMGCANGQSPGSVGTIQSTFPADALLNTIPFVLTHDAATGYLKEHNVVTAWARTQTAGFTSQLNCGARAFDFRPKVAANGSVILHHGGVDVDILARNVLSEVVAWASANQTDLVLVYVSHCDGDNCQNLSMRVFESVGIPYIASCDELANFTYGDALSLSALPSGGHVLGVFGCVDEAYDPSVECYAKVNGKVQVCYKPETGDAPFTKFWSYMNVTTAQKPPLDGTLSMLQAHWQSSTFSVEQGILHGSSLLLDESRSQVINRVTTALQQGWGSTINLLEVNHVCDGGEALRVALAQWFQRRLAHDTR
eukprot:m.47215 g.47215  ORF g.47215 m.47215 type:complete len:331 (-) comp10964_c0_seq1:2066-3058(-)